MRLVMASEDFLSEANVAGQTLLRLVSRGNAIIAELLRLGDNVPPVFRIALAQQNDPKAAARAIADGSQKRYGDIIFNFRYLKNYELYEKRIEDSPDLLELDTEVREGYLDILKRFYQTFESIYKYVQDILKFLEELEEGVFIQQTLDGILLNQDGEQLMAEAVYLYGVMMLFMDRHIEGQLRERLIISYLRYKGHTELPLIDEVCKLCCTTGFLPDNPTAAKPKHYPIPLFKRYPIPRPVVEMIIGRLRSDDIYSQMQCYPLPDHRSTALAQQASMLYIILYFAPQILKREQAIMREIVDKHFSDNWVVSYYLGHTIDLSLEWQPYQAAKTALDNTTTPINVRNLMKKHTDYMPKLLQDLTHYLREGELTSEYVLGSHAKLMNCLRQCNATIRWLILHSTTENKKLKELITPTFKADSLLLLILNTAQLEYTLKKIFQELLNEKDAKWNEHKDLGASRMQELADYFSGDKPLTVVTKNENLQKWFQDISTQVSNLDYNDSVAAGRKIQLLQQALEEVEQFHQIESSLQVKQFLGDTRQFLGQMLRIVNIREQYLVTLQAVADLSYAWLIIANYISLMQERIKKDPSSTIKLRSTFIKLASIMDMPLIRIGQVRSPDLYSVSEYYSEILVAFVRRVMEIIPVSMFQILNSIIELQTNQLKELPTKLEKAELKDFAQLDSRYLLAKHTYHVSMFTEGILAMETTLVGIIKVEPKQLLEEGIRKELVFKLANAMDKTLIFKTGKIDEFESRLKLLANQLDGFSRSFQYIQDYVNIYGLKIWQEEFSRIVNFNVEQECNSFLKTKVYEHQSMYQSSAIPIPHFTPIPGSVNFVGRLARALLQHTDYRTTIFLDQMSAWYDKEGRELVGIRTFDLLLRSVGVFGVIGLDKLLCFMIVKELQTFIATLRQLIDKNIAKFLNDLTQELLPVATIPTNTFKLYSTALTNTAKLWPAFVASIARIGQMQLLRRQIANSLNFLTKLDSNILGLTLQIMNDSVLNDIRNHYKSPDNHPYPGESNPLLFELTKYLEATGIPEPQSKIYITTGPVPSFPLLMCLFVISQMPKFYFDNTLRAIMYNKREKTLVDGAPFVMGIVTLMKQFHASYTQEFLDYLGQYVRGMINVSVGGDEKKKLADYPTEVINVLLFLEEYCHYSKTPRKTVESSLPAFIFDNFTHGAPRDA
eukprot:TRINITY_DN3739_c0_g1_i1.p1 TRINITY_DN3739_c0_g1~~TRINITY_DN3739_c0_g1_i1.p1  ORF type:complete len:1176 (-),score=252.84 TRINITY_DN3739_c0_g1_i1:43-3570(-)